MNPFITILNPCHHFRHECELINQKKGGYIEAEVVLPYQESCWIELSLAPNVEDNAGGSQCHPNLVHIAVKKKQRRTREQMKQGVKPPKDYISVKEWRLLLEKRGDQVYPIKLDPKCVFRTDAPIPGALRPNPAEGTMTLKLGPESLMVTVVQTLLKPDNKSISARSVLEDIREFQPEFRYINPEALMKSVSTNEARLRIKMQTAPIDHPDQMLTRPLVNIVSQEAVKNSKSAVTAPLKILKSLSSGKFCQEGKDSRVMVVLRQKVTGILCAEFVLMDDNGLRLEIPSDTPYNRPELPPDQVYHGNCAEIMVPTQDSGFVQKMKDCKNSGYKLCLVLHKQKENAFDPSHDVVPVEYVFHGDPHCCLCSTGAVETRFVAVPKSGGKKRPAPNANLSLSTGKRANNVAGLDYSNPPSNESGYSSTSPMSEGRSPREEREFQMSNGHPTLNYNTGTIVQGSSSPGSSSPIQTTQFTVLANADTPVHLRASPMSENGGPCAGNPFPMLNGQSAMNHNTGTMVQGSPSQGGGSPFQSVQLTDVTMANSPTQSDVLPEETQLSEMTQTGILNQNPIQSPPAQTMGYDDFNMDEFLKFNSDPSSANNNANKTSGNVFNLSSEFPDILNFDLQSDIPALNGAVFTDGVRPTTSVIAEQDRIDGGAEKEASKNKSDKNQGEKKSLEVVSCHRAYLSSLPALGVAGLFVAGLLAIAYQFL